MAASHRVGCQVQGSTAAEWKAPYCQPFLLSLAMPGDLCLCVSKMSVAVLSILKNKEEQKLINLWLIQLQLVIPKGSLDIKRL